MIAPEKLWDYPPMQRRQSATTYVQISREEFEDWLDTLGRWQQKKGTAGIYQVPLSANVAVQISSTMASQGQAMGYADASIQMRLVSLITGQVLNKKAQGVSHFKRTKNWRSTLEKAFQTFKGVYLKSQSFYDSIAVVSDRDAYKTDMLQAIESISGWESMKILKDFHAQVSKGAILSSKQKAVVDRIKEDEGGRKPEVEIKPEAAPQVDEDLLQRLRQLWLAARKESDTWTMEFTRSVGEQYKRRGTLTEKQMKVLEGKFKAFRV